MIDGSYSFTDISRKLFAGLAGQSGRSLPACAVLAGDGDGVRPPRPAARSAARSGGGGGPSCSRRFSRANGDATGGKSLRKYPGEAPRNLVLFGCVEREALLANTGVLEGEKNPHKTPNRTGT